MTSTSAISEWPDVDVLYGKFRELVGQPMRSIKPENMKTVMRYFDERCQVPNVCPKRPKKVIPAACNTTWLSITLSLWPCPRRKARISPTWTATATSISCKPVADLAGLQPAVFTTEGE